MAEDRNKALIALVLNDLQRPNTFGIGLSPCWEK